MYHPGRVVRIFTGKRGSIGDGMQAMVNMWDENLFTFTIDPAISERIREGDVVLVDYNPMATNSPHLRRVVTKILRGKSAEETWRRYKDYYNMQKTIKEATRNDYMG